MLTDKEFIKFAEQAAGPDLWRKLYPRIYTYAPLECCSPKLPAAMLLGSVLEGADKHPFDAPTTLKLISYSMPMLWLDSKLAAAMRNTAPPQDYDLFDLNLPMPAMIILLPEGCIKTSDGEVRFIAFARYEAREINDKVDEPHLFLVSGASNGTLQSLSISPRSSKLNLNNMDAFLDQLNRPGTYWQDNTGQGTDADRNKQVAFYFMSTLLLLNARPKLSIGPKLLNRVHKKGNEPREFWSPHILGANYTARREGAPQGSHQSPRMHWVRGFWRNQQIGSRTVDVREHKLMWIEPFLRGVL
jgi:hypothetical protein